VTANDAGAAADGVTSSTAHQTRPTIAGRTAFAMSIVAMVMGAGIYVTLTSRGDQQAKALADLQATVEFMQSPEFIEDTVGRALDQQPKLVLDALTKLQETALKAITTAPLDLMERAQSKDGAFFAGAQDPVVTIVEFIDHNCPYCRSLFPTIEQVLSLQPDVRLVFREIPIITPDSKDVSVISLALRNQGLYMRFMSETAGRKGKIDEAGALEIAQTIGADMDQLRKDRSSPEISKEIRGNLSLAEVLVVSGTPTMLINDRVIRGVVPTEVLLKHIAEERDQALLGRKKAEP